MSNLVQGRFGPIFDTDADGVRVLDWDDVLSTRSVTYMPLRSTEVKEDVELFGRIILLDLKQVAARRHQAITNGVDLRPALVVIDEFAALREPTEILDLLRQSREAKMFVVLATQTIPLDEELSTQVMQAGLILCHRLDADGAEKMANLIGTKPDFERGYEHHVEVGATGKSMITPSRSFRVKPDDLKRLRPGIAVMLSTRRAEPQFVQIFRPDLEETPSQNVNEHRA